MNRQLAVRRRVKLPNVNQNQNHFVSDVGRDIASLASILEVHSTNVLFKVTLVLSVSALDRN